MNLKKIVTLMLIVVMTTTVTGCWNYREIDKLLIVAGVAIDKGIEKKYMMTVEVVDFKGGKDTSTMSKTITVEGKTIFDAARNVIAISGKRLYWSHAKALILSKEIAEISVVEAMDWFSRDSETREDVNILIAKEQLAKNMLEVSKGENQIRAFDIGDMMKNEKSLSKAPSVEVWHFVNDLSAKGRSAVAPVITLKKTGETVIPEINGTAIFKKDKLIGFIDGDETKDLLFVQDEIKGGILVQIEEDREREVPISLEIFKSKTKIEPVINDGEIKFNINIVTTTAIDEIGGTENYIEDAGREKLENFAEKNLKVQIERLIKKVQNEYGVDIFGFGSKLMQDKPNIWKDVKDNWSEKFKHVKVNVNVKVVIKNSGMLSKPLEVGD